MSWSWICFLGFSSRSVLMAPDSEIFHSSSAWSKMRVPWIQGSKLGFFHIWLFLTHACLPQYTVLCLSGLLSKGEKVPSPAPAPSPTPTAAKLSFQECWHRSQPRPQSQSTGSEHCSAARPHHTLCPTAPITMGSIKENWYRAAALDKAALLGKENTTSFYPRKDRKQVCTSTANTFQLFASYSKSITGRRRREQIVCWVAKEKWHPIYTSEF